MELQKNNDVMFQTDFPNTPPLPFSPYSLREIVEVGKILIYNGCSDVYIYI